MRAQLWSSVGDGRMSRAGPVRGISQVPTEEGRQGRQVARLPGYIHCRGSINDPRPWPSLSSEQRVRCKTVGDGQRTTNNEQQTVDG